MKAFDNTPQAWRLRDRDFPMLIAKLRAATTVEMADRLTATAFGYVWLAVQAGRTTLAQVWMIELGTAVDAHPVVGGP